MVRDLGNYYLTGDTNFNGVVDIFDCIFAASKYDTTTGSPNYDLYADLSQDGIVDIFDLVRIGSHFQQTTPHHMHMKDPELHYQASYWGLGGGTWTGNPTGSTWSSSWLTRPDGVKKGAYLYGNEIWGTYVDIYGNTQENIGAVSVNQGRHLYWGGAGYNFIPIRIGEYNSHTIMFKDKIIQCSATLPNYAQIGLWVYIFPPEGKTFMWAASPSGPYYTDLTFIEMQLLTNSSKSWFLGNMIRQDDSGPKWLLYPVLIGGVNGDPFGVWTEHFMSSSDAEYIFNELGSQIYLTSFHDFRVTYFEFLLEASGGTAEAYCDYIYWYKSGS